MDIGFWAIVFVFAVFMLCMIAILVRYLMCVNASRKTYDRSFKLGSDSVSKNKYISPQIKNCIDALERDEIGCHILKNFSKPYNVDLWIENYKSFSELPIYKQLLSLRGEHSDV